MAVVAAAKVAGVTLVAGWEVATAAAAEGSAAADLAAVSAAVVLPAMLMQAAAAGAPEAVTGRDRAPSTRRLRTAKAQRDHGRAYLARRSGSAPSALHVLPSSGVTRRRTVRWRTARWGRQRSSQGVGVR